MEMKTETRTVSGHDVEIEIDLNVFDLAVINFGKYFALVETSRNDTSFPVIFVNEWSKKDIRQGLKGMSLFGYVNDEPEVSEEQLDEITNFLFELKI